LAKKVSEIAALPEQKELLRLWKKNNGLKPERPMFTIDQVCWNEMNYNDELTLVCTDPSLHGFEWQLRETLYRYKHMKDDRVIENNISVSKCFWSENFGIAAVTEGNTQASTHIYIDQLKTEEDLETKIKTPKIIYNKEETKSRKEKAEEIFDGILNVKLTGWDPYFHYWDQITTWRGVDDIMFDLADRPEFIHKIVKKVTEMYHSALDQYEALGLINTGMNIIHCTGAYTDELPGFNGESFDELDTYTAKNSWTYSAPQLFSMISPNMHEEFDIEYCKKWFSRFGLGYYGCCEPNDNKIDVIRKIPNIRKISMSPWAKEEIGAEKIGIDFVYSRKPNPSYLAYEIFDSELIKNEFNKTLQAIKKYNCPVEFILKDLTTVKNEPSRIWQWAKIAEQACGKV
ncbi:MAG: hypothetical protein K0S55_2006, partial [Clostridia bacterium]|nr:hypothetical protein [Clostridia bacterium]